MKGVYLRTGENGTLGIFKVWARARLQTAACLTRVTKGFKENVCGKPLYGDGLGVVYANDSPLAHGALLESFKFTKIRTRLRNSGVYAHVN